MNKNLYIFLIFHLTFDSWSNNGSQGYNYGTPQPNYNNGGTQYGYTPAYNQQVNANTANNYRYTSIASKVRTVEILIHVFWLIFAVFQIVIGLAGYYTLLIVAAWNIVNSIISIKNTSIIVAGNPAVIGYFENRKTSLITILVVNIVIGGAIGAVFAIVGLVNRNYVLKNKEAFEKQ